MLFQGFEHSLREKNLRLFTLVVKSFVVSKIIYLLRGVR